MSSHRSDKARRTGGRKGPRAGHSPAPDAAPSAFAAWFGRHRALVPVLFALVVVASIRLRIADIPLERDEGEYAYAGQLILRGVPPYSLAYNMKFPGTYYAYAVILAAFGQTSWGIHVGLLCVNAVTTLILFSLARRLLGELGGVTAAIAFAFLSLDRAILGVFAHATHFLILPALAAFLLILRPAESRRLLTLLGAGALIGLAVMMKQHAVFFLPLAIMIVCWDDLVEVPRRIGGAAVNSALLAAGAAIPFVLLIVVFAIQGVVGRFVFWTIRYAKEYVSQVPLSSAWLAFASAWQEITAANWPIWLLAGFGLLSVWFGKWPGRVRLFASGFLVAALLAIAPGFYFRTHYFIVLLPAAALLAGVGAVTIERVLGRMISAGAARAAAAMIFVILLGMYVFGERTYLFSIGSRDFSRTRYGANPFVEAPAVAAYLRGHTAPGDRIAVIGSEPEIYFYAQRLSATGYIYTYPLMEPQPFARRMQEEMIQQIEAAHPKYLVFVSISTSWLARPESDKTILEWTKRYADQCYDVVGIADIYSLRQTEIVWDVKAATYQPRSQNLVVTLRRKSDAPCATAH